MRNLSRAGRLLAACGLFLPSLTSAAVPALRPLEAVAHYEQRDFPDAQIVALFEAAAASQDPRASFWLARLYARGRCSLPVQPAKAADLARESLPAVLKLAEQGDPEAQFLAGSAFQEGLGAERDFTKAKGWFEKAAASGHRTALNNLGMLYLLGHGVKPDVDQARRLFVQSAQAGLAAARQNLIRYRDDGRDDTERFRILRATPLVKALGLSREDGLRMLVRENVIKKTVPDAITNEVDTILLSFTADGVTLTIDPSERITSLEARSGAIPLGLSWDDTPASVQGKLGIPDDQGGSPKGDADVLAYHVENLTFVPMFNRQAPVKLSGWKAFEKWAVSYDDPKPASLNP